MTETPAARGSVGTWAKLRQRKLVQWGLAYAAGSWVLLQVFGFASDAFGWPSLVKQLAMLALVAGLPIALVLAWYHGEKGEQRLTRPELAILTLLLALGAGALWFYDQKIQSAGDQATRDQTPAAVGAPPEMSVAVLPFADMSEKHDQEYFSDGLSEELIDHLTRAPGLLVIARTSSFRFKGRNEDARTIGRLLGAAHLLEGSVRTSGQALRITVQLIRAADGTHVWSQTYDRHLGDIFKVQDEIAVAVAQRFRTTFQPAPGRGAIRQKNVEAYSAFLKAKYFLSQGNFEGARDMYREAIRLDADYAEAWAYLGQAYWEEAYTLAGPQRAQAYADAREAVSRSLAIDPDLLVGHAMRALQYTSYDRNWTAAKAEITRMREIDPGDTTWVPRRDSELKAVFGRLDELIALDEREVARDPLDLYKMVELAFYYFAAGRSADAAATLQRVVDLNPEYPGCQACLAQALTLMGRADEAIPIADQERSEYFRLWTLPIVYWAVGRRAEADAALDEFKRKFGDVSSVPVAEAYAFRNDRDAAFESLERALRQHDVYVVQVKFDPFLRNLHADPRYKRLLETMGIAGDAPH